MASTVASVSCAGATALTVSLRGRMPSPADRTSSQDMTEPPAESHRSDRPGWTDEIRSPHPFQHMRRDWLPEHTPENGGEEMSVTEGTPVGEGHEIEVPRAYDAPRGLVFDAWTKGEHLKNWFAPTGFTVPEVESDPTEGG